MAGWGRITTIKPDVPVTADVVVRSARSAVKYCVNGESDTLALGCPVMWGLDGKVWRASAVTTDGDSFCGITGEDIPPNTPGLVYRSGWVTNAIVGLGAHPGQPVFLSITAGTFTLTPPSQPGSLIFKIGTAEPGDGVAGEATDLWIDKTVGYVNG